MDANLEVKSYVKSEFNIDAWKMKYEAVGMLDYFESHRNETPRNIFFSPETQQEPINAKNNQYLIFVLEPVV